MVQSEENSRAQSSPETETFPASTENISSFERREPSSVSEEETLSVAEIDKRIKKVESKSAQAAATVEELFAHAEKLGIAVNPDNLGNIAREQKELEKKLRELEKRRKFVAARDGEGRLTGELDREAEKTTEQLEKNSKNKEKTSVAEEQYFPDPITQQLRQSRQEKNAVKETEQAQKGVELPSENLRAWQKAREEAAADGKSEFVFNGQRHVRHGDEYLLQPEEGSDLSEIEAENFSATAAVARERDLAEFFFNNQRYVRAGEKYILHPDNPRQGPRAKEFASFADVLSYARENDLAEFYLGENRYVRVGDKYVLHPDSDEGGDEAPRFKLAPSSVEETVAEPEPEPEPENPEEPEPEPEPSGSGPSNPSEPPQVPPVTATAPQVETPGRPERLRQILAEARERYAACLLARLDGREPKANIEEARRAWREAYGEYMEVFIPERDPFSRREFMLSEYDKLTEEMIRLRADALRAAGVSEKERFSVDDILQLKKSLVDAVESVTDEVTVKTPTEVRFTPEAFAGEKPKSQEQARERVMSWLERESDLAEKRLAELEIAPSDDFPRLLWRALKSSATFSYLWPESAKRGAAVDSDRSREGFAGAVAAREQTSPWGFDLLPEQMNLPDEKIALTSKQRASLNLYIDEVKEGLGAVPQLDRLRSRSFADFVSGAQTLAEIRRAYPDGFAAAARATDLVVKLRKRLSAGSVDEEARKLSAQVEEFLQNRGIDVGEEEISLLSRLARLGQSDPDELAKLPEFFAAAAKRRREKIKRQQEEKKKANSSEGEKSVPADRADEEETAVDEESLAEESMEEPASGAEAEEEETDELEQAIDKAFKRLGIYLAEKDDKISTLQKIWTSAQNKKMDEYLKEAKTFCNRLELRAMKKRTLEELVRFIEENRLKNNRRVAGKRKRTESQAA